MSVTKSCLIILVILVIHPNINSVVSIVPSTFADLPPQTGLTGLGSELHLNVRALELERTLRKSGMIKSM